MQNNIEKLQKILEESEKFLSIEEEVCKLYCLISCAVTHEPFQDHLSVTYLKEKVGRILEKKPLILDQNAKQLFAMMVLNRKKTESKEIK